MSVFKDDQTTYTGNLTVLGSLSVGGNLTVTGTATIGGNPIVGATPITNSLSGDVNLNNTANYFDGPSMAQGSVGTWWASGTVTISETTLASIAAKLWDGTTIIASGQTLIVAGSVTTLSLSGFIVSPAGNIRISCKDNTNTSGKIVFNQTGNSKDSTISAIRVA